MLLIPVIALTIITANGQRSPSSTEELAQMIDQKQKDPLEKVRAAYSWVTTHITYNTEKAFVINNSLDPRAVIDVAFQRRAGVCENFASIFTDVCQKMGFLSVVISGYGIQNSMGDRISHSWSAVFIDGDWYLFDPTWDAGRSSGFVYFKKAGEEFLATHQPFDPLWQMTHYPRLDGNKRSTTFFNYKDSIKNYFLLDSLRMFETAASRIDHSGKKNELTKTHQKVVNNNLEIKRQEQQMEWYDQAIGYLNEVSNSLNDFIDLRNEQFSSVKEEGKLRSLLAGLDKMLDSAGYYLAMVDHSKATLVFGTGPAREQMERLGKRLAEQKLFLEKYLVADFNQRKKLF